ncbi:MAG TPA: DNA mismatch repair protein MutS [Bacillota bacterium]|nr:DNA mismatch repair protein MutS [Bacillota bacterium]
MKVHLMYKDRDFDMQGSEPFGKEDLVKDLRLDAVFEAMARGDKFIAGVVSHGMLLSLTGVEEIRYRQEILRDCMGNAGPVRSLYSLAVETIENEKEHRWGIFSNYPESILHRSVDVMKMYVEMLRRLREFARESLPHFSSDGFSTLFQMLQSELDEEYMASIQKHIQNLEFKEGIHFSAVLGEGFKGVDFNLCEPREKQNLWKEFIRSRRVPSYTYCLAPRDESGARALSELKDRGLNTVANALAQSSEHILSFFQALRTELAFYIGCLNLMEELQELKEPFCIPDPGEKTSREYSFGELIDAALALSTKSQVVGNDMNADGKKLTVITGANQGGKTTFLRSVGQAQIMMQCGMFVSAERFSAGVCDGIFTHFKREEDDAMKSGKLDEELGRMSRIADVMTADSMILFNESFASTNEREGSEIGAQIVKALLEKGVRIFTVTHLYQFSSDFYQQRRGDSLFLRADRGEDGSRSFKLAEGEPLKTGYGDDLYHEIFEGG